MFLYLTENGVKQSIRKQACLNRMLMVWKHLIGTTHGCLGVSKVLCKDICNPRLKIYNSFSGKIRFHQVHTWDVFLIPNFWDYRFANPQPFISVTPFASNEYSTSKARPCVSGQKGWLKHSPSTFTEVRHQNYINLAYTLSTDNKLKFYINPSSKF